MHLLNERYTLRVQKMPKNTLTKAEQVFTVNTDSYTPRNEGIKLYFPLLLV